MEQPNYAYAKSLPGILKIATLVLGFCAIVLGSIAVTHSYYADYIRNGLLPIHCSMSLDAMMTYWKVGYSCLIPPIVLNIAVGLMGAFWVVTVIELIVLLLVKFKNDIFDLVDFVAFVVIGAVYILAGLVYITFSLNTYIHWKNCLQVAASLNLKKPEEREKAEKVCQDKERNFAQPDFFLSSGVVAVVTGVLYILSGVMVFKSRQKNV